MKLLEITLTVPGESPEQKAFIKEWNQISRPNPMSDRFRLLGNVGVELWPWQGTIRIARVISTEKKGEGQGTAAMKKLMQLADKHHVALTGEVKPFSGGATNRPSLTVGQLKAWYKKLGFDVKRDQIVYKPKMNEAVEFENKELIFKGKNHLGYEASVYRTIHGPQLHMGPVIYLGPDHMVGTDSPNAQSVPGLMKAYGDELNVSAKWNRAVQDYEIEIWHDLRGTKEWVAELRGTDGKYFGTEHRFKTRDEAARAGRRPWLNELKKALLK
jgi:hypothetical protein